jgi:hypothetical protein
MVHLADTANQLAKALVNLAAKVMVNLTDKEYLKVTMMAYRLGLDYHWALALIVMVAKVHLMVRMTELELGVMVAKESRSAIQLASA